MIKNETIIVRNRNIETVNMDNEIGMINVNTGKYYMLDPIGADIWNFIESEITFGDLIEKIQLYYNVEKQTCISDMTDFVNELQKQKLLDLK